MEVQPLSDLSRKNQAPAISELNAIRLWLFHALSVPQVRLIPTFLTGWEVAAARQSGESVFEGCFLDISGAS
jgi:hypothetical protein